MKVIFLKTGKTEEYDSSYAARLIEQGKAIPAPTVVQTPQAPEKSGKK